MPHWLRMLFMFHWLNRRRNTTTISVDDVLKVADQIDRRGKGHPTRKRKLCQVSPRDGTRCQTGNSITSHHSKMKKTSTNKKRRLRRMRAQELRVRQRSAYSEILRVRRSSS